ncbi:MAG: lysine--tRNA ligase [Deltaproteobacteria bacterium]|nr:lysine--tRNA ligase [Deltaproteobacteria bacterium]
MAKSTLAQLRDVRLDKVAALRKLGLLPYPSRAGRTHLAGDLVSQYPAHEGQTVTVCGRLMSFRDHGALSFAHVQDQSGRIQLFLRKNQLGETRAEDGGLGYADLKLLDVGDLVEATGPLGKTNKGEVSVLPIRVRVLTKSLRPLPDKWAGLTDREAILRRRYLDTTLEPERRAPFEAIARMLQAIREFLTARGFLEFHTPVLQPQYGGGTARPFTTHLHALDTEVYLSISHELYLKRLIVAGFDKVFTIGRYFRNEGIDARHHPEFSMVETMTAYEDYTYNMDLVEGLFAHVARRALGRTVFKVQGHEVDLGQPWRRVTMVDAVREKTGEDFSGLTLDAANAVLARLGAGPEATVGLGLVRAFELAVEPTLRDPTLVYNHPVDISPLAKPLASDPRYAERFEIFIGGMECGDNWSEQNDPVELLARWKDRYDPRAVARGDAHPLDYDFLEVLEYGMPPTTGIGPGIERMAMIMLEQQNIDDVLFFPLLRPTVSEVNREVYGLERQDGSARPKELCLTFDDLQRLVADGSLKAPPEGLTARAQIQRWNSLDSQGNQRFNGHFIVEGWADAPRALVAGLAFEASGPDAVERALAALRARLEVALLGAPVTYGDASVLAAPAGS